MQGGPQGRRGCCLQLPRIIRHRQSVLRHGCPQRLQIGAEGQHEGRGLACQLSRHRPGIARGQRQRRLDLGDPGHPGLIREQRRDAGIAGQGLGQLGVGHAALLGFLHPLCRQRRRRVKRHNPVYLPQPLG